MKKTKLQEAIRENVKGIYFCDPDDNGEREIWQPFENWDLDDIEDQVDTDVYWWTSFIDNNKELILEYLATTPNYKKES